MSDSAGEAAGDAMVYLDHAASSPWRDCARDAYWAAVEVGSANASGSHRAARRARLIVDDARDALGELLGVDPGNVVFTSGGTESDNLAVLGRHEAAPGRILISAIEHPAVAEPALLFGAELIGCGPDGRVDLAHLEELLGSGTGAAHGDGVAPTLVSVMTVNNEVGTIQPVVEVAELCRELAPHAAVHTDAVQALSWVDLRGIGPSVDLLAMSAHKFGGPQGVGLCYVRRGTAVQTRHLGGGQERELRSGTHNVAAIAAMAAAAIETDRERTGSVARIGALRDRLVAAIVTARPDAVHSATPDGRTDHLAAGFAHVCFRDVESEALLFLLDEAGVCASAASACASGAQQQSGVLAAIGVEPALARGSLRLSLGHTTTESDVDRAIVAVDAALSRLNAFRG